MSGSETGPFRPDRLEAATHDQPLSLLRVKSNLGFKTNSNGDDDLLTIRILETSEKKMRIIKDLLSSEKNDDIYNETLSKNRDQLDGLVIKPKVSSVSTHLDEDRPNLRNINKTLSRSDTSIRLTNLNLQQSHSRKVESIEFFFHDSSQVTRQNLAIELRSGYPLSSLEAPQQQRDRILKNSELGMRHRLIGLLDLFGVSSWLDEDLDSKDEIFLDERSNNHPYARKSNIRVIKHRLELEGHSNKIRSQQFDGGMKEKQVEMRVVDMSSLNEFKPDPVLKCMSQSISTSSTDFAPLTESRKLITTQVSFVSFIKLALLGSYLGSGQLLRKEQGKQNLLKIGLNSICLTKHPLMLMEEKTVVQLVDIDRKYSTVRSEHMSLSRQLIDLFDNPLGRLTEVHKKAKTWATLTKRLILLKNEFNSLSNAMNSLRQEQGFEATSASIQVETPTDPKTRQLINRIDNFVSESQNLLSKDLKAQILGLMNDVEPIIEANANLLVSGDSNRKKLKDNWPEAEQIRRREIDCWLKSFRIMIQVNGSKFYDAQLVPSTQCDIFNLKVPNSQMIETNESELDQAIEIRVEIYSRELRFLAYPTKTIASSSIRIRATKHKSYEFMKIDIDEGCEIEVGLCQERIIIEPAQPETVKRFSTELVDSIYDKTFTGFNSTKSHEQKISELLNRVDFRYICQLLAHQNQLKHLGPHLALDPFVDKFWDKFDFSNDNNDLTLRQSLIIWRWRNNLNQLIHINRGEIIRKYRSQLGTELKSGYHKFDLSESGQGYGIIEQISLNAIEFIKEYESTLKNILEFNARKFDSDNGHLNDILREPHLRLDLSSVAKAIRGFIPRHTASRPLMPNRMKATKSSLLNHQAIARKLDLGSLDDSATLAGKQHIAKTLNLVVTIQQATNLPMRMTRSLMQPSTRSNSPFFSTSPSAVNFMRAQEVVSPLGPKLNQIQLSPPTTYVEIIFQRNQSATSLAFGKNPSWNETLFMPVDFKPLEQPLVRAQPNQTIPNRLIDDFLYLNVYDYFCYLEDDNGEEISYNYEPTTMNLVPSEIHELSAHSLQSSNAKRLSSSRQKIERHLLGTLKIPLSTLIANSKIEGSFALHQPLFLDNYQFETKRDGLSSADLFANVSNEPTKNGTRTSESHISLFITLDPPMAFQMSFDFPLGSHESNQIFEYAKRWEQIVRKHRYFVSNQYRASNINSTPRMQNTNWLKIRRGLSSQPNRHVRALVLQKGCKYCLITRLLAPLEPPQELLDNADVYSSMLRVARFVSLLSPIKAGQFSLRHLDSSVWFDSVQLVEDNLGGPEEKAVLLCNYFLSLGQCSALLLGDAVPDGRCVYVIVWNEQTNFIQLRSLSDETQADPIRAQITPVDQKNFIAHLPVLVSAKYMQLWDPKSGKSFHMNDVSPLISVGSIVTPENVYANIQLVDIPADTNFDIRLKNLWCPLFESAASGSNFFSAAINRKLSQTLRGQHNYRAQVAALEATRRSIGRPSIEPIISPRTQIVYQKINQDQCKLLRDHIERAIKASLLNWRRDRPTYFNRTLSRKLSDKLISFEAMLASVKESESSDWKSELADLIKDQVLIPYTATGGINSRQVISWPANISFTSVKSILDSLYASSVHSADLILDSRNESSLNTEFIVASHVYPYPARVISVWLYVAALVPSSRKSQKFLLF